MAVSMMTEMGKIQIVVDHLERGSILYAIHSAQKDIAALIWAEHKESILKDTAFVKICADTVAAEVWEKMKTKIMAEMDLKGLASLIAVYAAKDLKPESRGEK